MSWPDDRVKGFWHGSAGDGGHNWQAAGLNLTMFAFLARHAGHALEVVDEYALDARLLGVGLGLYKADPAALPVTALTPGPGVADLDCPAIGRTYHLGRPLTCGGAV